MQIREMQTIEAEWTGYNFPDAKPHQPLLGICEEAGELCHAHLKAEQGIRNSKQEDKEDAVADIFNYMCHYCTLNRIDLEHAIISTWSKIRNRDWKKYTVDGVTE